MAKRTFVVAVDPYMDNFSVLGLRHMLANGDEVVIHNTPDFNMVGDKTIFNFDIFISGKLKQETFSTIVPSWRLVEIPRHGKVVQHCLLQQAAAAYSVDHTRRDFFINVPTWKQGWGGRNYPVRPGRMVVKPNDGARGIGQFVVDTHLVNIDAFLKSLNALLATEYTAESLAEFLAKYENAVTYHTGSENKPLEGLATLKEQGVIVQSVVEDISSEYRIITNKDCEPTYVQKRRIRDPESVFPQATGGGSLIDKDSIVDIDEMPGCVNRDMLNYLCRHAIGPMSSIDLFVTNDGHWGIFEFCNQFGISGIPQMIIHSMHVQFMEMIIDRYLTGEANSVYVRRVEI